MSVLEQRDSRPIPDPTVLTTEQLKDKIQGLRELLEAVIKGKSDLVEERFASIQQQFRERDSRMEQQARDAKTAVDAAFAAQKEAVSEQNKTGALAIAKSEAATNKQIDQLAAQLGTINGALDGKINDLKERFTRLESSGLGAGIERRQSQTSNQLGMQAIAMIVGAIGVTTAIVMAFVTLLKP